MITRIRIEASGNSKKSVENELDSAIKMAMSLVSGNWKLDATEYAPKGVVIFQTHTAWWGYIVAKKVDV